MEHFQCPACYSKAFRFTCPDEVQCCICGSTGKLEAENTPAKIKIKQSDLENHFWTLAHRQHHLEGWMEESKQTKLLG